jgi:malic enzyme
VSASSIPPFGGRWTRIPIGKLSLYTQIGGVHPQRKLSIVLDVHNTERLNDSEHLGWRHERIIGQDYFDSSKSIPQGRGARADCVTASSYAVILNVLSRSS